MSRPRVAGDTRRRIEQAALKLFAARGVDGASMRDIAGVVAVTEGALYRHFPSKSELARTLFLSRYCALARGVDAVRARHEGFAERLDALVELFTDAFDDDPDGFAFVLVAQHDHLRDLPADAPENAVEALGRVFAEAMANGDIPHGDVGLVTAIALGAVVQPAIFAIYGRLPAPSTFRREIALSIRRAIGAG